MEDYRTWTLAWVSTDPRCDGYSEARVSGPSIVPGRDAPVEVVPAEQLRGAVDLARRLLHAIPHDHSEATSSNPSGRCPRCRFADEFDHLGGRSEGSAARERRQS